MQTLAKSGTVQDPSNVPSAVASANHKEMCPVARGKKAGNRFGECPVARGKKAGNRFGEKRQVLFRRQPADMSNDEGVRRDPGGLAASRAVSAAP
jgi:hypothetical protein